MINGCSYRVKVFSTKARVTLIRGLDYFEKRKLLQPLLKTFEACLNSVTFIPGL